MKIRPSSPRIPSTPIAYSSDELLGNYSGGITIWTSEFSDGITVEGTHERAGVRTTTTLNTGAGSDDVIINLEDGHDGFFVLNLEEGDDVVDASGSNLPLIIFGNAGADQLLGFNNIIPRPA